MCSFGIAELIPAMCKNMCVQLKVIPNCSRNKCDEIM
jgi:hypothetical protein